MFKLLEVPTDVHLQMLALHKRMCAHTHRSHRDTETHQWIKCKQPLQENLLFWLCSWQCQNMSECVRIIQNSCHRFKVQTLLQPSKCLLGLLSKGGIDTVEQAPSPGGILEPICPYESRAQEKYLANIRQVPITWNIVRCTRTVLTGLRAISPRLPQLEWCWLGFDLLWLWPVLYWIMSSQLCQAQRDIFDEEFDRVDAGTMTAARGFRAAGRHEFAPRWWARNGPASVPASACLHPAWFVFVLGVLVTSRDHWWNTDSFSFTQAEEPPVRQQPVYAQRHELRGLCGGCDGLVTACYGMLRLCFLFLPIHHSSNPVL